MILEPAQVTASGRPSLDAREIELLLLDQTDLEFPHGKGGLAGNLMDVYKGGYAVLTSKRLIWMDNVAGPAGTSGRSCWLPIHSVQGVKKKSQLAFTGTKVRLMLDVAANFEGKPVQTDGKFHKTVQLALRCRGESPDSLLGKMQDVLRQPPPQAAAPVPPAGPAAPSPYQAATLPNAARPLPPQQQQATQQQQQQFVDDNLLHQLIDMGFPRNRAARSLLATSNSGCQPAIDYMLAFGGQPGMDDPLPSPQQLVPTPAPAAYFGGNYASTPATQYGQTQYPPQPIAPSGRYGQSQYAQAQYGQQPYGQQPYGMAAPYPPEGSKPSLSPYGQLPSPYHPQQLPVQPSLGMSNPLSSPYQLSASQQQLPPAPVASHGFVGIAGIVRREEQKATDASRSLGVAFQDLQALMGMAADMVKLAERFRGVMAQSGQGNEDELMDRETQLQLIEMGITSPVTKESAGARYNVELSRQLADFLVKPLQQAGGIMTLPDVYCLYNRARGTELVSPDDLLQAIKAFSQLGLPLKLRNLPSGLPVVQSAAHSDEAICEHISKLVTPGTKESALLDVGLGEAGSLLGPSIATTDVARFLDMPQYRSLAISLPVAREHLLTAELKGVLCRDDGPEGLRFYRNFFPLVKV